MCRLIKETITILYFGEVPLGVVVVVLVMVKLWLILAVTAVIVLSVMVVGGWGIVNK